MTLWLECCQPVRPWYLITDGYYMGGVIAERLALAGISVTLCTPSGQCIAMGTKHTAERWRVRSRLMKLGVRIIPAT